MSNKKSPHDIFLLDEAPAQERSLFQAFDEPPTSEEDTDMFSLWRRGAIEQPSAAAEIVPAKEPEIAVAPTHVRLLPLYRRTVGLEDMLKLHDTLSQELELSEKPPLHEFLLRAFLKIVEREQLPFRTPCLVSIEESIMYEAVALPLGSSFTVQLDRPRVVANELPTSADALLIDLTDIAADDILLHEHMPTITIKRGSDEDGFAIAQLAVRGDVTPLQANTILAGLSWFLSEPLRLVL